MTDTAVTDDRNGAPEGVTHSHAERFNEDDFAIVEVTHPDTNEPVRFTVPATNSGADEASISAAVADADTGSGTEVWAIAATVAGGEVGSGDDSAVTTARLVVGDDGTGADSAPLLSITTGELGQGADNAAFGTVTTTVNDAGLGIDAATIYFVIAATDVGLGVDRAAPLALVPGPYRWRAGPLQPRWSFGPLERGTGNPDTAPIRAALALVGGDSH